jgi:hypothetical protein
VLTWGAGEEHAGAGLLHFLHNVEAQPCHHRYIRSAFGGGQSFKKRLRDNLKKSVLRIWIGSGFNQVSGSGSIFRRAKIPTKVRKKLRNIMFWCASCSLLRAEGFSCSLDMEA